jgi:small-conductance mechanosensitive channel
MNEMAAKPHQGLHPDKIENSLDTALYGYRKQAVKQAAQQVRALEQQLRSIRDRMKKLPKDDAQARQVVGTCVHTE